MMPDVAGAALLLSGSPELSLLAKATVILAVGIGVTHIARTARASVRHLIIATANRAQPGAEEPTHRSGPVPGVPRRAPVIGDQYSLKMR